MEHASGDLTLVHNSGIGTHNLLLYTLKKTN